MKGAKKESRCRKVDGNGQVGVAGSREVFIRCKSRGALVK